MTTLVSRSMRLGEVDGVPVLRITEVFGKRVRRTVRTHYRIEKNTGSQMGEAYRLHKLVHSDEEPIVYDVRLGRNPSCDCQGFEGHGHCKHLAAMLSLKEDGSI